MIPQCIVPATRSSPALDRTDGAPHHWTRAAFSARRSSATTPSDCVGLSWRASMHQMLPTMQGRMPAQQSCRLRGRSSP